MFLYFKIRVHEIKVSHKRYTVVEKDGKRDGETGEMRERKCGRELSEKGERG